jgi:hypothetical protein
MLQLRLLPPRSYRLRHRPPEWEVIDEVGSVVGWIEEHHIPTSGSPFYDLIGVHPVTGEHIRLQLSADRDERLRQLERFLRDPDAFHVHYPTGPARRALESKLKGPVWQSRSSGLEPPG